MDGRRKSCRCSQLSYCRNQGKPTVHDVMFAAAERCVALRLCSCRKARLRKAERLLGERHATSFLLRTVLPLVVLQQSRPTGWTAPIRRPIDESAHAHARSIVGWPPRVSQPPSVALRPDLVGGRALLSGESRVHSCLQACG